ncbi:MAG TPA: hypothetical protein PLW01_06360 [Agitococcus sp.]|mgnify:FL=1|nr:hypothetical protein [Agitococcus sp.]
MYALRQIYDHPQAMIPVPEQMRNHRIEVTFMALDEEQAIVNVTHSLAQALAHPASADIDFEPVHAGMGFKRVEF